MNVNEIPGADALVNAVGEWPAFHDAEILSVKFQAPDPSERSTLEFEIQLEPGLVATIAFEGLYDLQMEGFDRQNVIFDLEITQPGKADGSAWEVLIFASVGITAAFSCDEIIVTSVQHHA